VWGLWVSLGTRVVLNPPVLLLRSLSWLHCRFDCGSLRVLGRLHCWSASMNKYWQAYRSTVKRMRKVNRCKCWHRCRIELRQVNRNQVDRNSIHALRFVRRGRCRIELRQVNRNQVDRNSIHTLRFVRRCRCRIKLRQVNRNKIYWKCIRHLRFVRWHRRHRNSSGRISTLRWDIK
jgi:hypothetical protein